MDMESFPNLTFVMEKFVLRRSFLNLTPTKKRSWLKTCNNRVRYQTIVRSNPEFLFLQNDFYAGMWPYEPETILVFIVVVLYIVHAKGRLTLLPWQNCNIYCSVTFLTSWGTFVETWNSVKIASVQKSFPDVTKM